MGGKGKEGEPKRVPKRARPDPLDTAVFVGTPREMDKLLAQQRVLPPAFDPSGGIEGVEREVFSQPPPEPPGHSTVALLKDQVRAEYVGKGLTLREERVLDLRFGLETGRSMTLKEVGEVFGVTRERIRQVEAKALRKLRKPERRKKLRDYLE